MSPFSDPAVQIITVDELRLPVGFVMMVAMQHDLEPALRNAGTQVLNERFVIVQGMNRPALSKRFGDALTRSRSMERHNGK